MYIFVPWAPSGAAPRIRAWVFCWNGSYTGVQSLLKWGLFLHCFQNPRGRSEKQIWDFQSFPHLWKKKKQQSEILGSTGWGFSQHCKKSFEGLNTGVGLWEFLKIHMFQKGKTLKKKQTPGSTGSQFTYWNFWSPRVLCTFLSLALVSCQLFNFFFISFISGLGVGFLGLVFFCYCCFFWLIFLLFLYFLWLGLGRFPPSARGATSPIVPQVTLEPSRGWEGTLQRENCFTPGCRKVVGTL